MRDLNEAAVGGPEQVAAAAERREWVTPDFAAMDLRGAEAANSDAGKDGGLSI